MIALEKFLRKQDIFNKRLNILELGFEPASHHRFLPKNWSITSANFHSKSDRTLSFDLEKAFPINTNTYDGVIAFNTLYAVYCFENCINESLRVARSFVLFNVPFITRSTPDPHDFTRLGLERLINIAKKYQENGLIKEYKIIPYGGSWSAAVTVLNPYFPFTIIRVPIYYLARLLDTLDSLRKTYAPIGHIILLKK